MQAASPNQVKSGRSRVEISNRQPSQKVPIPPRERSCPKQADDYEVCFVFGAHGVGHLHENEEPVDGCRVGAEGGNREADRLADGHFDDLDVTHRMSVLAGAWCGTCRQRRLKRGQRQRQNTNAPKRCRVSPTGQEEKSSPNF